MSNQTKTYIRILVDTLKKKEQVMRELLNETQQQTSLLDDEALNMEAFEEGLARKEKLLERLAALDEGFLDLYGKAGAELKANPAGYAQDVEAAQQLIRTQTALSAELTALEERNKERFALRLTQGKQKVKDFKVSSKTAAAYYKNMSGKHQDGDSYFLDRKK